MPELNAHDVGLCAPPSVGFNRKARAVIRCGSNPGLRPTSFGTAKAQDCAKSNSQSHQETVHWLGLSGGGTLSLNLLSISRFANASSAAKILGMTFDVRSGGPGFN